MKKKIKNFLLGFIGTLFLLILYIIGLKTTSIILAIVFGFATIIFLDALRFKIYFNRKLKKIKKELLEKLNTIPENTEIDIGNTIPSSILEPKMVKKMKCTIKRQDEEIWIQFSMDDLIVRTTNVRSFIEDFEL